MSFPRSFSRSKTTYRSLLSGMSRFKDCDKRQSTQQQDDISSDVYVACSYCHGNVTRHGRQTEVTSNRCQGDTSRKPHSHTNNLTKHQRRVDWTVMRDIVRRYKNMLARRQLDLQLHLQRLDQSSQASNATWRARTYARRQRIRALGLPRISASTGCEGNKPPTLQHGQNSVTRQLTADMDSYLVLNTYSTPRNVRQGRKCIGTDDASEKMRRQQVENRGKPTDEEEEKELHRRCQRVRQRKSRQHLGVVEETVPSNCVETLQRSFDRRQRSQDKELSNDTSSISRYVRLPALARRTAATIPSGSQAQFKMLTSPSNSRRLDKCFADSNKQRNEERLHYRYKVNDGECEQFQHQCQRSAAEGEGHSEVDDSYSGSAFASLNCDDKELMMSIFHTIHRKSASSSDRIATRRKPTWHRHVLNEKQQDSADGSNAASGDHHLLQRLCVARPYSGLTCNQCSSGVADLLHPVAEHLLHPSRDEEGDRDSPSSADNMCITSVPVFYTKSRSRHDHAVNVGLKPRDDPSNHESDNLATVKSVGVRDCKNRKNREVVQGEGGGGSAARLSPGERLRLSHSDDVTRALKNDSITVKTLNDMLTSQCLHDLLPMTRPTTVCDYVMYDPFKRQPVLPQTQSADVKANQGIHAEFKLENGDLSLSPVAECHQSESQSTYDSGDTADSENTGDMVGDKSVAFLSVSDSTAECDLGELKHSFKLDEQEQDFNSLLADSKCKEMSNLLADRLAMTQLIDSSCYERFARQRRRHGHHLSRTRNKRKNELS